MTRNMMGNKKGDFSFGHGIKNQPILADWISARKHDRLLSMYYFYLYLTVFFFLCQCLCYNF